MGNWKTFITICAANWKAAEWRFLWKESNLDPPLHEFVPTEEEDIQKLADAQGKTVEQIKAIIDSLHEFNRS